METSQEQKDRRRKLSFLDTCHVTIPAWTHGWLQLRVLGGVPNNGHGKDDIFRHTLTDKHAMSHSFRF